MLNVPPVSMVTAPFRGLPFPFQLKVLAPVVMDVLASVVREAAVMAIFPARVTWALERSRPAPPKLPCKVMALPATLKVPPEIVVPAPPKVTGRPPALKPPPLMLRPPAKFRLPVDITRESDPDRDTSPVNVADPPIVSVFPFKISVSKLVAAFKVIETLFKTSRSEDASKEFPALIIRLPPVHKTESARSTIPPNT